MQKRFLSLTAVAMMAVILFSSCSKDNKQGRYVPDTAGVVIHLNGESLNSKLPWEDIKQNELFKQMVADSSLPAFAKSVLDNPDNSGIDIKNDLIIFMAKDSAGNYAAIEGFIKDEVKFKQFLVSANKNAKETVKDGYTYFADEKVSIGYNKERFVAAISTPGLDYISRTAFETDPSFGRTKTAGDMNTVTAMLLNLKEDESLAKNEKFTELVNTKGDIHFWYSAPYFMPAGGISGLGAMANLDKFTKDAVTTSSVSFDNGKISMNMKSYANKEIMDLYKKYSSSNFDKTMVKNIPSKNLAGMFAFSFKPEAIREFLKLMNMDGFANIGAAQLGFSPDDFIKASRGDVLFSVTDIARDTAKGKRMNAQFIFSASTGDKTSFNKLIDAGKKIGGSEFGNEGSEYSYNINDKYFVLSNNKTAADTYLAGTANNSFDFLDKISGGPFGGYVNFQYILKTMQPSPADSLDFEEYNASVKLWDNLLISGGNYEDGGITQHWEINLMDKNTNSLKQLNNYIGVMGSIDKKKQAARKSIWDSMDMKKDQLMIDSGTRLK